MPTLLQSVEPTRTIYTEEIASGHLQHLQVEKHNCTELSKDQAVTKFPKLQEQHIPQQRLNSTCKCNSHSWLSGEAAFTRGLGPHKASVHTITYDNGREFSEHAGMALALDAAIYFAHPYASWERGVNENTNGLIRQFFAKDRDLTLVSEQELTAVRASLNHRPRKPLGFRTPHEVCFDTTISLTVALTS